MSPDSNSSSHAVDEPAVELREAARTAPDDAEGWIGARAPRGGEIVRRILRFPWLLGAHRDLITTSVKRELEARFKGTVLGWAWPLVQPLFLFAVYYFIFTELLGVKFPSLPEEQKAAMGVFMFVGITVWATMAETLTRGTSSIVDNGNLIKKLAFPSEVLPLNLTLAGLVTLTFAVAMFVLACVFTPMWPAPGIDLVWIPLILVLQGVFTYGLALLLSTLQVFLRDTIQVVGIVVTIWMFATPLFWTPAVMKPGGIERYVPLIEANPVYHLVQAWRVALMGEIRVPPSEYVLGGYAVQAGTIPHHLAVFAVWALAAFVAGYSLFVYAQRRFADEV